jgi:type II secretory pathway pseudopilin PulG
MVELIVVISIFLILTMITIFNYGQFRSSLSIQNLADDISLVVRKAQTLSTGVQIQGPSFSGYYGVHFTANTTPQNNYFGFNKQFILFFDGDKDNKYTYAGDPTCGNPSRNNECLEALKIKSNDKISLISHYDRGRFDHLNPASVINIIFRRPHTEPYFFYQATSSAPIEELRSTSYVRIKIESINDPSVYRYIRIYKNGQISVNQEVYFNE